MSRLADRWKRLKRIRKKGLVPFITAGDPTLAGTARLVRALEEAGADLIELGVPFSDPMADGPVIQRASERALKAGTNLGNVLRLVRRIRRRTDLPLILMGYYNPILAFGLTRFAREAKRSGVDGVLVVDLPPEESAELDRELRRAGIALINLLTPTSDRSRIEIVTRRARGFIYFVSLTGITGSRIRDGREIRQRIAAIRRRTPLPVVIGFGIRKPGDARRLGRIADGVVVGSAVVRLIEKGRGSVRPVARFVSGLRRALDS